MLFAIATLCTMNDVPTFLCWGGVIFTIWLWNFIFVFQENSLANCKNPSLKQQQTKPIYVHVFMCMGLLISIVR